MDIDLSVLRQMEREKEIPFEELVQIIEQAILTAYQKHTHQGEASKAVEEVPEARVVLDRKSGHVDIFVPEHDEEGNVIGENLDNALRGACEDRTESGEFIWGRSRA